MTLEYHIPIKDMPVDLRPRERLLKEGPAALTDIELLAIVLRTGTASASVLELSTQIMSRFLNLRSLLHASTEELSAIKGIGPVKAAQIKAAMEFGRRVATSTEQGRRIIKCPEDAAGMVMEEMRHFDREHFRALLLNTKNQVLYQDTVSIGTLNSSAVHPRELFKNAIKCSAAAVILIHNHPSGDPTPSRDDIEVTRRISEAGVIIGIEVLDHIIIGDNKFVSLKSEGMF